MAWSSKDSQIRIIHVPFQVHLASSVDCYAFSGAQVGRVHIRLRVNVAHLVKFDMTGWYWQTFVLEKNNLRLLNPEETPLRKMNSDCLRMRLVELPITEQMRQARIRWVLN